MTKTKLSTQRRTKRENGKVSQKMNGGVTAMAGP